MRCDAKPSIELGAGGRFPKIANAYGAWASGILLCNMRAAATTPKKTAVSLQMINVNYEVPTAHCHFRTLRFAVALPRPRAADRPKATVERAGSCADTRTDLQ